MLNFDRYDEYLCDGRLTSGMWTGKDADGRAIACALAALSDEVAEKKTAEACPAADMRPWLARLVTWIDDAAGGIKNPTWIQRMTRLGRVLRPLVALDDDADRLLRNRIGVAIVREAVSHVTVDEWGVRAACEQVIAALESGDAELIAAAEAAAMAAVRAAARPARAARAARAAAEASLAAVGAASWATAGAAGAAWAAGADGDAAELRLVESILAEFEKACGLS